MDTTNNLLSIFPIPEVLSLTVHGPYLDTTYTYQIFQEYTKLLCVTSVTKSKSSKSAKVEELYHASIHRTEPDIPQVIDQQLKTYLTGKIALSLTQ